MNLALISLVAFALWAVFLGMGVVLWRGLVALQGRAKVNEFPAGEKHGSDIYWRWNRAHANTVENLPIMASVVLVAWLSDAVTPSVESAALAATGARLVQSLVHISSGSQLAVMLRATGLSAQYICFVAIAYLSFFR
jgi:uncharacterized MAPEG superfamily protein